MLTVPLTFPLDYLYPGETSHNAASVTKLMHRLMQLANTPITEENKTFLLECAKDMQAHSVAYRVAPHIEYLSFLTRHIPKTTEQTEILEIFSILYLAQRRIGDHINIPQHFQKEDPALSQATKDAISNLCKTADGLAIMLAKTPEMQERIADLEKVGKSSSRESILAEIEYQKTVLESVAQAKVALNEAFENLRTEYRIKKDELMVVYKEKLENVVSGQRTLFMDVQDAQDIQDTQDTADSENNEVDECGAEDPSADTQL
ncbi:Hypothetical protein GLP15_3358 [Giardia lamblia P15]|uniref:Uncharacterized protein n=1 Tax=Giardia intestinalis (strain P15) TaxID=658858 RepID=E1EVV5_GIAIA|nr:Hypothetical protein GLP15_3358 [Giardia lamblia P15]